MRSSPVAPSEMTTISTLCATSTVLVAPTGLTFARPYPPASSSTVVRHQRNLSQDSTPTRQQQSLAAELGPMTCFAPSKDPTLSSQPATSSLGPPSAWNSNRSSLIREDADSTKNRNTNPRGHVYTQRPSSSVSGQGVSRANTYSSSSTQPFFAPTRPSTHRPNKLVKRSLSQSSPNSPKNRDSPPSGPLFRRPATSHYWTPSWNLNRNNKSEVTDKRHSLVEAPEGACNDHIREQQFIHFPRVVKARKFTKSLARQGSDKGTDSIRRIRPDGSKLTLLFARSVVPAREEIEEQIQFEPHPESPRDVFPNQYHTPVISSSPLNPSSAQTSLRSERYGRQSLAYFKSSPTRMLNSSHSPASRLKRKLSQRISSAPTPVTRMDASKTQPSPAGPRTPRVKSQGLVRKETSPSVREIDKDDPSSNNVRHISMSSGLSSSPDGSYTGHRVFSWGIGEDDGSTSDTVYDSFRTATTRSSYGTPRPPLETLFDKSMTTLDDRVSVGVASSPNTFLVPRHRNSQHTVSTDDRTSFVSAQATPQAVTPRQTPPKRGVDFRQSPEYEQDFADDEADWDALPNAIDHRERSPLLSVVSQTPRLSASPSDFGRVSGGRGDPGLRNSVFDWSEPPPLDKGSDHETPPRPKTVHGKKRQALGNQSTNRRAQGGLHARSQSVPAFQDLTGRRSDVTHKFGTWGVGGKGATEDWDDDFDFGQPSQSSPVVPASRAETPLNNFTAMRIPENIQKQQNNVLANIGLLKEWGLLIEELKDLRVRAAALGVRAGDKMETFEEVDAMIDLADQEHEDDALSVLRSPTSSQFSDEETEGFTPPRSLPAGQARMSPHEMLRIMHEGHPVNSSPVFRFTEYSEPTTRPRKDSEAVAQSVIQALHQGRQRQRTLASPPERVKKMPFDTATLKHIVPYVNGLMRQVKDMIRDAEGFNMSPTANRRIGRGEMPEATKPRAESPSAQRELRQRLKRDLGSMSSPHNQQMNEDYDLEDQLNKMDMC